MMLTIGGKASALYWQYIFEGICHTQFRSVSLVPKITAKAQSDQKGYMITLTDEQVDEGYNYILPPILPAQTKISSNRSGCERQSTTKRQSNIGQREL